MLDQLKNIEIKVFSNGCGKFRAEALCPICQKDGKRSKLSFSKDDGGNWHIYSLTRHSNTMHFPMPECSMRKRRRTDTAPATSSVTVHPPEASQFNSISNSDRDSDRDDSLETPNISTSTASHNDSYSITCDPLSLHENDMNVSSDLREEQPYQELESMEEERIDEEHDGNF